MRERVGGWLATCQVYATHIGLVVSIGSLIALPVIASSLHH